jgi:hypothetical protein
MNKIFSYILIAVLLFPVFGQAFAATAPITTTGTPAPQVTPLDPKAVVAALKDIYTRLNSLSSQTQLAINQLNGSGVITDQAQTDLIGANTILAKAKIAIDKLNPQSSADTFKTSVAITENYLKDGRTTILTSLSDLKAALTTTDSSN